MAPRFEDMAGEFLLLLQGRRQAVGTEDLREAQDGVERRAQFMAHRRQEGRLGIVGAARLFHRHGQFAIRHFQLHRALVHAHFQFLVQAHDFLLRLGALLALARQFAVRAFQRVRAQLDLGQHLVEGIDQLRHLVVAELARAARVVARLDHFARHVGDIEDGLRDDEIEAAQQQQGHQQRQHRHAQRDGQVIGRAAGQLIIGAQIHGAQQLAIVDDGLEQFHRAAGDADTFLAHLRRQRAHALVRAVAGKQAAIGLVQGAGRHARADAHQVEVFLRQAFVVEGQRGRTHVPEQLGLGTDIGHQVAVIGAQVVDDDGAQRNDERHQGGQQDHRHQLVADGTQSQHGQAPPVCTR